MSDAATLRNGRRVLSALCTLAALGLVVLKTQTGPSRPTSAVPAFVAALGLVVSLIALVVVWRKEHAAAREESAARERQQLAMLQLQVALAKKKTEREQSQEG